MSVKTRVTICNSQRDRSLRAELEKHLAMLCRTGAIEVCQELRGSSDRHCGCGAGATLESADVILLLVSPDFLASDYCYDFEARRALELQQRRGACVIPVILRPCDWRATSFGKLPAAPAEARPITLWRNKDAGYLSVVGFLKNVLPGDWL
jgi:hypothetical protein